MGLIEYPFVADREPVRKRLGDVFTSRAMLIAFSQDSRLPAQPDDESPRLHPFSGVQPGWKIPRICGAGSPVRGREQSDTFANAAA